MVHVDGIPSYRFPELGGQTVLHSAQTPHLDHLATQGEMGRLGIPEEPRPFTGGMALLALLGYDTKKWFMGPGTFEAMNLEVVLERHDVAFLCHLVTLRGQEVGYMWFGGSDVLMSTNAFICIKYFQGIVHIYVFTALLGGVL